MRFVDRSSVAAPASLCTASCAGEEELEKARAHYSSGAHKAYKFSAYKGADVVTALYRLFHGKCAYCESSYEATQPVEVEHYRPKGGVEESAAHPGYWWLAAAWDNLLPSCVDCNRRRRQIIATPDMTIDELKQALLKVGSEPAGKLNAFPTEDDNWVMPEGNPIPVERPLLIDPTRSNPEEHIDWYLDGDISVLNPREDDLHVLSVRGRASIDIYALNRLGLVQARTRLLLTLLATKQLIEQAIEAIDTTASQMTQELQRNLVIKLFDILKSNANPDRPYSSLAEAFIKRYFSDLEERLK